MFKIIQALILMISVSAFAHIGDDPMELRSDSGIRGPSYIDMKKGLAELQMKYPNVVELIPVAKSLGGRHLAGVLLLNKEVGRIDRLTIITGATHGNEYLNIADRLPKAFIETKMPSLGNYIANNGAVLIVPIINPDGYERRRRYNNNNVDLNRDFPNALIDLDGLSQPETNSYVNFVRHLIKKSGAKLDMVVDYHCCHGSLLYPFGYTSKRISKADLDRHVFVAELMQNWFKGYVHGITGEVLGYFPRGTTKDFWYLEYGALAYTFEGKYRVEKNNLVKHLNWWEQVFAYLNTPALPFEM
ncbi:MAG: DUF2817 domain-containing protein [Bdellovibrionota bacterium]|nr:hypothetical protein [Pseudobdellovibrionaceae bacterium]|tara:strand:+ start:6510 stop:7412 length:903 start_codon:yes stop_codon:yes gene_type:complete